MFEKWEMDPESAFSECRQIILLRLHTNTTLSHYFYAFIFDFRLFGLTSWEKINLRTRQSKKIRHRSSFYVIWNREIPKRCFRIHPSLMNVRRRKWRSWSRSFAAFFELCVGRLQNAYASIGAACSGWETAHGRTNQTFSKAEWRVQSK